MSSKRWRIMVAVIMVAALVLPSGTVFAKGGPPGGGGGGDVTEAGEVETAGNNLSFPVIWAEGATKTLRSVDDLAGVQLPEGCTDTRESGYLTCGEWWFWWGTTGTDPNVVPLSCAPDVSGTMCADGTLPGEGAVKAYLQKDALNVWQAGTISGDELYEDGSVGVHRIDWGDNLESVDWYTRSQVRTEVVLYQDLVGSMVEYEMRHTSGWGINEVHGMATALDGTPIPGAGTQATVYSPCARLTIQKLLVETLEDPGLTELTWTEGTGWSGAVVNPDPIFNGAVHEAADGPGYYNAEINVKGKIIYGYTWNVRDANDGPGYYRITFSFDQSCGTAALSTFFMDDVTSIIVPLEEELELAALESEEGSDTGGATAVLVPAQFDESGTLIGGNLTYIDVRILERTGGGNGGGDGGNGNGGEGGNGNGGAGGKGKPTATAGSVEEMAAESCPPGADCDRIREQDRAMEQDCECTHECAQECECCQNGTCDPNCECPCNCEQEREREQEREQEQAQEQEQEQNGPAGGGGEETGEENQNQEREREGPPNRDIYLPLLTTS